MALALLEMTRFDDTSRSHGSYRWRWRRHQYAFYRMIEKPSHLISQRLRKYTPNALRRAAA